jgi:hypothetical protein
MHIFLKNLHGETLSLQVDELDTIRAVKQQIEDQFCYPVAKQQLHFRGKRLSDEQTLEGCGIKKRSTLLLLLKGGSKEEYDDTYNNLTPCKNNSCIFFGQDKFLGLCSKCYIMKKIEEKGLNVKEPVLGAILPVFWTNEVPQGSCIEPSTSDQHETAHTHLPGTVHDETTCDDRCFECKKKIPLTSITCRCMRKFCSTHRYSDRHNCPFSYIEMGRQELEKANPRIVAPKIQKL